MRGIPESGRIRCGAPYCSVHLQGTFEKLPMQSANWSVLAWASVINNSVGRMLLTHCDIRSLLHPLRPRMAWPAQDSSSTTAVGKYTQRTFTWPVRPLAIGFWYWMRIERTSAELLVLLGFRLRFLLFRPRMKSNQRNRPQPSALRLLPSTLSALVSGRTTQMSESALCSVCCTSYCPQRVFFRTDLH